MLGRDKVRSQAMVKQSNKQAGLSKGKNQKQRQITSCIQSKGWRLRALEHLLQCYANFLVFLNLRCVQLCQGTVVICSECQV